MCVSSIEVIITTKSFYAKHIALLVGSFKQTTLFYVVVVFYYKGVMRENTQLQSTYFPQTEWADHCPTLAEQVVGFEPTTSQSLIFATIHTYRRFWYCFVGYPLPSVQYKTKQLSYSPRILYRLAYLLLITDISIITSILSQQYL